MVHFPDRLNTDDGLSLNNNSFKILINKIILKLKYMGQSNLFKNLIEALTEKELYTFAKLYLLHVDGIQNIVVCNGPWDSGIDLMELSAINTQYQATVEKKGIEIKIYNDLEKAKRNVIEHDLPNKVKYFYSHPLSNTTILKIKREAKIKHDLIVDIVEANILSEVSEIYEDLSSFLIQISKLDTIERKNDFFNSIKARAFYDLISFGSSTDIKYNIIKSYVLNFLIDKVDSDKETVLKSINQHFGSSIDVNYFNNFLQRISTEKKIRIKNSKIELRQEEKDRIQQIIDTYQTEEIYFIKQIQDVLDRNSITLEIDQILTKLTDLYESNYSINLEEFTNRESNIKDLATSKKNLLEYIKTDAKVDDKMAEKIAKELIDTSDQAEILSRIAVGKVYLKISDPQKLAQYISENINNKKIFLDTNVLIYLILVHYDENAGSDVLQFRIANQFLKFARVNNLVLKTIRKYSIETAYIFKEAIDLVPFTKLEIFKYLGAPSNMVYRHYLYLKENDFLSDDVDSFEGFLREFKFSSNYREGETFNVDSGPS